MTKALMILAIALQVARANHVIDFAQPIKLIQDNLGLGHVKDNSTFKTLQSVEANSDSIIIPYPIPSRSKRSAPISFENSVGKKIHERAKQAWNEALQPLYHWQDNLDPEIQVTLNSVKRGTVRTTGHSLDKMARVERKLIDKITKYPQRLAVWQNKVAKVTKKIVEALIADMKTNYGQVKTTRLNLVDYFPQLTQHILRLQKLQEILAKLDTATREEMTGFHWTVVDKGDEVKYLLNEMDKTKKEIKDLSTAIIALQVAGIAAIAVPFPVGLALDLAITGASMALEASRDSLTNHLQTLTDDYIETNRILLETQRVLSEIVMDEETCVIHLNRLEERRDDFRQLMATEGSWEKLDLWSDLEANLNVTIDNTVLARNTLVSSKYDGLRWFNLNHAEGIRNLTSTVSNIVDKLQQ